MTKATNTTIPASQRGRSPVATAMRLIIMVCVVISGLTVWRIIAARTIDLQSAQIETRNLTRALADHAHATMEIADTLLTGLVERIETGGDTPTARARLHAIMKQKVGAGSRVRDLFVFDPDGNVIATSLPSAPEGTAVDREYFRWHRANPARGPHFGPPVKGRHNERWTLTVSRRVNTPDGAFAGVVVATIDAETFSSFYASFDVGPQGSIVLAAEDSTLLVRHPPVPSRIGATNAAVVELLKQGTVGDTKGPSVLDGVMRYSSFRKTDAYPLLIFVSRSEFDILEQWRHDSMVLAATTATLMLGLGLIGWRLRDQIRQRQRAETDLSRSEQLFRLLADNSTDVIIHSNSEYQRIYVSPASKGLLGYTPQEMMALRPQQTVHPDDLPILTRHFQTVQSSPQPDTAEYRVRRRDGSYIWVEVIARSVGKGQGSVAAIRDIAARKEAEAQLHAANNALQRIAMQDGLTAIANRRAFDLALQKEMRRCTRSEQPLAALLIDVDHFKAYNDINGHTAGDECLIRIAQALEQQMRRPADLVARYGGEEFVVLLPDTEQAGATHCAQNLMAAIRALAIPREHESTRIVTVSIGVAVGWPSPNGPPARALIDAADAALYEAKRAGRARIHLAELPHPTPLGTTAS